MKLHRNIYLIFFIIFLNSCSSYNDLDIGNVKAYHFNGFKNNRLDFTLTFPIENTNRYNIVITEINLKAYNNNRPLGILEMNDKIVIEKKSNKDYNVPITIKITNLLGSLSLLTNPNDLIGQLSFEGYIKARKGMLITKINIDKETSKNYINF